MTRILSTKLRRWATLHEKKMITFFIINEDEIKQEIVID